MLTAMTIELQLPFRSWESASATSSTGRTHHYLEVVAGDDFLSVLHPADCWRWVSRHSTLQLDVSGLISIRVGWVVQELRRHCRKTREEVEH